MAAVTAAAVTKRRTPTFHRWARQLTSNFHGPRLHWRSNPWDLDLDGPDAGGLQISSTHPIDASSIALPTGSNRVDHGEARLSARVRHQRPCVHQARTAAQGKLAVGRGPPAVAGQALEVLGFWLSGSGAVPDKLLWQGRAA